MLLLEREGPLSQLTGLFEGAAAGNGSLVLVRGEAGIGKTSLVRSFVDQVEEKAHVLRGACDDLVTARPLGPIWDMAFDEAELERALAEDDRNTTFKTILDLLTRSLRPTIMVIEDVHWADEATLDLIKFVGRRIDRTSGLIILTYRDGEAAGDQPLRMALGDLPPGTVTRIALEPLSRDAVAGLVGETSDADAIWELTGGNPFFVSELSGSQQKRVPGSVRDAVNARLMRLSDEARRVVELTSVVPGKLDFDLLDELLGGDREAVQEAEDAGILVVDGASVRFRHELSRRAVEADLAEIRRRRLNSEVLIASEALDRDLSHRAHHAREAGDVDAILRLLPTAAKRASELESHREAVGHLRALEPHVGRMTDSELADHFDLWAWEEYLADYGGGQGIIHQAIALRRGMGDPIALGKSLLIASRIAWVNSRRASAVDYAEEAVRVLGPVGGEELAMAYSTVSQLAMLGSEVERTLEFAEKALNCVDNQPGKARAHALNNIGAVLMVNRFPAGIAELEESYRMAETLALPHESVRAAVNLAWGYLMVKDTAAAQQWIDVGQETLEQTEMPTFESYLHSEEAIRAEMNGEWDTASSIAADVLDRVATLDISRMVGSQVLARILVRRGSPDARRHAIDAWERAKQAEEIQRTGPAGCVLAEYLWLGGEIGVNLRNELRALLQRTSELGALWQAGELAQWLTLAGVEVTIDFDIPDPFGNLIVGEWEAAALFWNQRGLPYEHAVALSGGDVEARLEALAIMDDLGAIPMASRLRSGLRGEGIRGVPRGPQRARRENPLGLTPRQAEVLALLAKDLSNAEIADQLFLSTRTVDHHVSAILGALGAGSRRDAVRLAGAVSTAT